MNTVTATIGKDLYTTNIVTESNHHLLVDEPTEKGGADQGPTPEELLAASLGACTCITLRMYADRKQWPVEKIEAHIDLHYRTDNPIPTLGIEIRLTGNLDEEQRQRMLIIAGKCPMHKILSNPISVETRMI